MKLKIEIIIIYSFIIQIQFIRRTNDEKNTGKQQLLLYSFDNINFFHVEFEEQFLFNWKMTKK